MKDHLFIISQHLLPVELETGKFILGNADAQQVIKYYESIALGKIRGHTNFVFYVADYQLALKELKHYFVQLTAAGGVVSNRNGDILFINRLGKWDLPKGKLEKGEKIDECALREVEEECGVKVGIRYKIGSTWHTYQQKGHSILKQTLWFAMELLDDTHMQPQTEEAIEEVRWMTHADVEKEVIPNTYASIKKIYGLYLAEEA